MIYSAVGVRPHLYACMLCTWLHLIRLLYRRQYALVSMTLKPLSRRNSPTVRPPRASRAEADISCKQNTMDQLSMIRAHVRNCMITFEAVLRRVGSIEEQLAVRGLKQPATIEPTSEKQQLPTIVVNNAENSSVSEDGRPGHVACRSSVGAQ